MGWPFRCDGWQRYRPGGSGFAIDAILERKAAGRENAQTQREELAFADNAPELDLKSARRFSPQAQIPVGEANNPVYLHHPGQDRHGRKMTVEARKIGGNDTIDFTPTIKPVQGNDLWIDLGRISVQRRGYLGLKKLDHLVHRSLSHGIFGQDFDKSPALGPRGWRQPMRQGAP